MPSRSGFWFFHGLFLQRTRYHWVWSTFETSSAGRRHFCFPSPFKVDVASTWFLKCFASVSGRHLAFPSGRFETKFQNQFDTHMNALSCRNFRTSIFLFDHRPRFFTFGNSCCRLPRVIFGHSFSWFDFLGGSSHHVSLNTHTHIFEKL